jgi:hypothetical protein
MKTFSDVVDAADALSPAEQEDLVSILQKRLREQRRAELVRSVEEAEVEFREGKCKPASVEEIIKMIDS